MEKKMWIGLGVIIAIPLIALFLSSPLFAIIGGNNVANVCFGSKFKSGNLFCRGSSFERGWRGDNYIRLDKAGYKIFRKIYGEPLEGDVVGRYKLSDQGKNKVEASFISCKLKLDVSEDYEYKYGDTYETTTDPRLAFKNQRKQHYFPFCPLGDAPEIEYDSYKVNLIIDKDKDADGAYNYEDDCPNTYGRKENGCPIGVTPTGKSILKFLEAVLSVIR